MALTTVYIEVDSDVIAIDYDHITIEGADVMVLREDKRAARVEDYLGIGNPLIYR